MDPFVKAIASAAASGGLAAATGGSSLIPSVLGLGGSLASGLMGWQSTRETNDAQIRLAKLQNQFQLDAMRENNEFNRKMAFDMFDYESNYNSPLQQMQRLKEAGLNPAVGMAGNLGSSGNTSAAAPSAAGSGVSPVMPSLSVPGSPFQGAFDNLEAISRIFANVSSAKKQGAETTEIFKSLDAKVQNILADTGMKQVKADYDSTLNEIAQIEKQFKGVKGIAELRNMYADYVVKMTEGKYKEAETELKKIQGLVEDENLKILREQHPFLVDNVKKLGEKIDAEKDAEKASARASDASANKMNEEAQTERENRANIVRQAKNLADKIEHEATISKYDSKVKVATYVDEISQMIQATDMSRDRKRYLELMLDRAERENNFIEAKEISNIIIGAMSQGARTTTSETISDTPKGTSYSRTKSTSK